MAKSTPEANPQGGAQLDLMQSLEAKPAETPPKPALQWLDPGQQRVALLTQGAFAAELTRAKAKRAVVPHAPETPPAEVPGVELIALPVARDGLPKQLDAVNDAVAALELDDEVGLIDGTTQPLAARAIAACWLVAQGEGTPEALERVGGGTSALEDFVVGFQAGLDAEDSDEDDDTSAEDDSGDDDDLDDEEDEDTDGAGRRFEDEDEPVEEPRTEELPAVEPGRLSEVERRFSLNELGSLRPRASQLVGAVLGGAIGDAMGHPTEFMGMDSIRAKYGPKGVTKFELYWDRGGNRFAPYTDDTQMAEAVLRALLEAREQRADLEGTMKGMALRFIQWSRSPQGGHRAPGNACMSGCRALASGTHWSQAGGATAGGCGSVMRAYPFGLVFADDLKKAEQWAVEHSKLTHRDPIALAACAAMAVGVALALRGETVGAITSEMVAAACRYSPSTAAMMATAIDEARRGVGPEVTLDRLRAWAAHEAIASCVYLFERHPDDAQAAVLEGANTPGDSDSIATLAGALIGARCGVLAFPAEWVQDVERGAELAGLALAI